MGNIFDFRIFRAIDGATTTCANLTLWNRARHDELVEYLDPRPYGNIILYSKGSHVEYEPSSPVYNDERIPSTKDRRPHHYTYEEPQVGDTRSVLQAWTSRSRTPQQRRVYEKTVTVIRRQHIEPLQVTVPTDQQTQRPHVRHRVRFAPYPPIDSGSEQPKTPPMRSPTPTVTTPQTAENTEPGAVLEVTHADEEDWN